MTDPRTTLNRESGPTILTPEQWEKARRLCGKKESLEESVANAKAAAVKLATSLQDRLTCPCCGYCE